MEYSKADNSIEHFSVKIPHDAPIRWLCLFSTTSGRVHPQLHADQNQKHPLAAESTWTKRYLYPTRNRKCLNMSSSFHSESEISLLRLLEKITNGSKVEINATGIGDVHIQFRISSISS